MRPDRQSRRALTLVEVLIVISILSVLAAIVAPGLQRARAMARLAMCTTQLRGQAQAHAMYAGDNEDRKPPLLHIGRSGPQPDWVSPRIKWSKKPVGQGILVAEDYIPLDMLYCPSASMRRDVKLDRAAWEELMHAGSSYVYFWRHPSMVRDQSAPASGATYLEAVQTSRTALSMDVNCEHGHNYTGDYEGRAWPSHPAMGKVNVAYIDGSVRSYDSQDVVLQFPGGSFEELLWFDLAHRLPQDR